MGIRSMDSILSGEPSVHTLPEGAESDSPSADPVSEPKAEELAPPAPKAEASTATARVDDDDDAEESDPVDQSLEGLKKALTAVRGDKRKMRKQWREADRKAIEAAHRIATLEGQLAAYQQIGARQPEQPKAETPKGPDFYGSPEEYIAYREKTLREEFRQAQFTRDANRSEKRMRREHQDYEEAKAAVVRTHGPDSQFWRQMFEDAEPAELLYEEGKKILRGGMSESEAALQAKVTELEAKLAAQPGASVAPSATPAKPPIPKSNASARGSGNGVKAAWNGPRSMDQILGKRAH